MAAQLCLADGRQGNGSCCRFVLLLLGWVSFLTRLLVAGAIAHLAPAYLSICHRPGTCIGIAAGARAVCRRTQCGNVSPRHGSGADLPARSRTILCAHAANIRLAMDSVYRGFWR